MWYQCDITFGRIASKLLWYNELGIGGNWGTWGWSKILNFQVLAPRVIMTHFFAFSSRVVHFPAYFSVILADFSQPWIIHWQFSPPPLFSIHTPRRANAACLCDILPRIDTHAKIGSVHDTKGVERRWAGRDVPAHQKHIVRSRGIWFPAGRASL